MEFQEEDSVPNEVFSPAQPLAPKKSKSFQARSKNPVFFDQIPESGRTFPGQLLSDSSTISLSSTSPALDQSTPEKGNIKTSPFKLWCNIENFIESQNRSFMDDPAGDGQSNNEDLPTKISDQKHEKNI